MLEAVQGGLWSCIMCGQCTEVCNQAEIDHVGLWTILRDAAVQRGWDEASVEVPDRGGSVVYANVNIEGL